jgi:hypothetical protein
MHSTVRTRPGAWRWVGAALLVVLLGWLVPNPLPWRSPFQGSPRQVTGAAAGLAPGGGLAADTTLSVSASATPRPPNPRPPTPHVSAGFRGTWRGLSVNYVGSPGSIVIVTFPARNPGSVVATADFPTLGCREVWQLQQSTPTLLTLQATLAFGLCQVRPLRVQARLLDRTHLFVQWRLLDSVIESEAQLARV